jgi:hypothetical protein
MEKYIQLPATDSRGFAAVEAVRFPAPGLQMEKTASLKFAALEPEMRDFIAELRPTEGKLYVLVNALGAYEFWGPNYNADAFRESVLANSDPANGYKTFMKATVFRHHCFPAGTQVVRADHRRVPIESIVPGDQVLSGTGRPVDVLRTLPRLFDGPGRVLTISGVMDPLVGTDEHPVLVLRREQVHCRHKYSRLTATPHAVKCKEAKEPIGRPIELPLREVRAGDYLLRPEIERAGLRVDPAFARLVGWVASEGHLGSWWLILFSFSEIYLGDIGWFNVFMNVMLMIV